MVNALLVLPMEQNQREQDKISWMGNTALTRAFFKCLPLLTKDEEIARKCIKLYYMRGKKNQAATFLFCQEEKTTMELY